MGAERERKYLVRSDGWRENAQRGEHYLQGYLSLDPERSVRIRLGDQKALLTVKGKASGAARPEFEYPIPLKDARELLDTACLKPLIEKTRYRVRSGGALWEVDEFQNENRDLLLAELETASGKAPRSVPDWVGDEVSSDARYQNINLVQHPFSEWHGHTEAKKTKFRLKAGEPLAKDFRRIVRAELAAAIRQLAENQDSLDEPVHEARKSVKKVRAVLRWLRPTLEKTYELENAALRDVGRRLSEVRDATALIEIFDQLKVKFRDRLSAGSMERVRHGLVEARDRISHRFANSGDKNALVETLQEIRQRAGKWPFADADIDVLAEGLGTAVRRGKKAWTLAGAQPQAENYHEWRKRAKDLRYQLELVRKAWPFVFDGYLDSAKDLEERLGDDHNLVVLGETLRRNPKQFGSKTDVDAVLGVIGSHQKDLRAQADTLGSRMYGERPKEWSRRLRCSWDAWRKEARR